MIRLTRALNAWGASTFNDDFKSEVEGLDARLLPLQQGLTHGSYANEDNFNVVVMSAFEEQDLIYVHASIFYTSLIAGCNCADDPTPVDALTEHIEVQFCISKKTAETVVTLVEQDDVKN